jgi:arsenite-transporting ATPase
MRETEPVGVRALADIGEEARRTTGGPRIAAKTRAVRGTMRDRGPRPELANAGTRLMLFTGKGGVGKTTCAAATALDLARRHPRQRVLLLSTDPAHSLGDALGVPLSDTASALPGGPPNLHARELDPDATFREMRRAYLSAIDQVFDRMRGQSSFDASLDRAVMRQLLNLSPPGLDELAGILTITEAIEDEAGSAYDVIVMDTPPTGHAIRLLEMPGLMRDWTRVLMSILLKYESVSAPGELGALLLRLSRGLGRLQKLLRDRARTHVVAVTRTGRLPTAGLRRLGSRLAALEIGVGTLILNAVGRGSCPRCVRISRREQPEVAALRRWARGRDAALVLAPAEIPPPQGPRRLSAWHACWLAPAVPPRRQRRA